MRRMFWLTLGAAGAAVAYTKGRKTVERYLPAQVAERAQEQAQSFGTRLQAAGKEFVEVFDSARKHREAELTTALLAEGQSLEAGRAAHEQMRLDRGGYRIIEMARVKEED